MIIRWKDLPPSCKVDISCFSREFGLIAAIVLLCLSCLVTGLGTSAPLITQMMAKASKVSTDFYVKTNLPLAVLILLLLSCVPLMSFGRNPPSQLMKKLPWAAAGAGISLGVALCYGISDFRVLLIVIPAGAATGMNLVLAGNLMCRRFSLSGGALVHLGVGLMFLGIASSTMYDRSEKKRFYQEATTPALGYAITLSAPRILNHGKGVRLELPLNIEKGNVRFLALPDIYRERKAGGQEQRFVHPFIKRGIVSDLYISPVDFDSGEKQEPPGRIVMNKGQTVRLHPYTITFTDYNIRAGMGDNKAAGISVGAELTVAYKEEKPVVLIPVLNVGQAKGSDSRVRLPGREEAFVTLLRINANEKTIALIYEGPEAASEKAPDSRNQRASVILEVSIKPGMTLLWGGTFLMLFGGVIGIIRRRQS